LTNTNYLLYNATTGEVTYNAAAPSSLRFKKNITVLSSRITEAIYNLRPVEFDFVEDHPYNGKHTLGLIAEETIQHLPEVVVHNELDPTVIEGIDYEKLVVPLIQLAQDYEQRIASVEALVAKLVPHIKTR
jgi:hypothetical protein